MDYGPLLTGANGLRLRLKPTAQGDACFWQKIINDIFCQKLFAKSADPVWLCVRLPKRP
jgi:hypothetical protein